MPPKIFIRLTRKVLRHIHLSSILSIPISPNITQIPPQITIPSEKSRAAEDKDLVREVSDED
jgi:hypothetical protein